MRDNAPMQVIFRALLVVVLVGLALWFAWTVRAVLVLVLVAVILATGLSPMVDAVSGRRPARHFLRVPRAAALLIIYGTLVAGVALVGIAIIPSLIRQAEDFVRKLPAYFEALQQTVTALAATYPAVQGLDEWLAGRVEGASFDVGEITRQTSSVLRFALGIVNGVVALLLALVLTFYLVLDGDTIRAGVLRLLPARHRPLATEIGERMREKIGAWVIGQLLLSTVIGLATFVGLLVLGVPYPLLLAALAAVGELIPMLGPIIAGVPAVIIASFVSPLLGALTLALYVGIQQLENHILVPQVMRRAVDLPPVVVIVALLMGSSVLGIIGAILALPVAAALSVLLNELIALRDRAEERDGA